MIETPDWWNQPLDGRWVIGVATAILIPLLWIAHRQQNPGSGRFARRGLAAMMDAFAQAGLRLRPGLGVEDLLIPFPADAYLRDPALLLAIYGGSYERDGAWLPYCDAALNFDYEVIDDPESYEAVFADITKFLGDTPRAAQVTRNPLRLRYRIGEVARELTPVLDDDWADQNVVDQILADVDAALPGGRRLWTIEDGQAELLLALTEAQRDALANKIGITARRRADA